MSIYATEAPLVTEEERQRLYKRMEQQQPELWLRLYPRHYPAPPTCGEYYSAEDPGRFFLWQYHRVDHDAGVAEQPLRAMATSLMNGGMPMMWLSPALVGAIQHTFPPSNLDWTTMPLPSALMVMMVPRRTLVHPTEGGVRFIACSRIGHVDPDGRCDWVFSFVPCARKYLASSNSLATGTPWCPSKHSPRHTLRGSTLAHRNGRFIPFSPRSYSWRPRPDLVKESRLLSEMPEERGSWTCPLLGRDYQINHKP
jgi:hypothetical protein